MRRGGAFLLTGLVFLFFAEGQRAFFASLFVLWYDAVAPAFDPGAALLALLPLLFLLVPLLPLARLVDRPGAITVAAAGVAIFRLPMAHPALATRAVGAALVLACFGLFLTWAVGWLDRRALAAGAVAGLVADQLLRLAGTSYDLALQPAWVPAQAVLSLVLLGLAVAWGRSDEGREARDGDRDGGGDDRGLERRAGGLRLRGALALGPLLFLDLHVLGLPPVIARWADLPYEAAAAAAALAAGAALALALAGYGPTRSRTTVLGLLAAVVLALVAGWWWGGPVAGGMMAAGHGAALLLIARTLDPASGRRSRGVVIAVLALLTAFTGLYTLTFFVRAPLAFLDPGAPWVLASAALLLAGSAALLPAAAATPPALGPTGGVVAAAGVATAAALLLVLAVPRAGAPARTRAIGMGDVGDVTAGRATTRVGSSGLTASGPATLTVATGNARFGFDGRWRFDPHGLAGAMIAAAPDAVALRAVPVGLPAACGVDLALWLERRLGARSEFAPSANGLLGHALLTWIGRDETVVGTGAFAARPGAPGGVAIHAFPRLGGPGAGETGPDAWLGAMEPGPAVVMGAPAPGGTPGLTGRQRDRLRARLGAEGFRDAFGEGADPADPGGRTTAGPGLETAQRGDDPADWIWVRGLSVVATHRAPDGGAGFRLATATLASRAPAVEPERP